MIPAEASRGGHLDSVKFLVEKGESFRNADDDIFVQLTSLNIIIGADVTARTRNGATALWWAKNSLPNDHLVIEYLTSIGAPDDGGL